MRYSCFGVLAGLFCVAPQLHSQGSAPANEVHHRNECRLADQVVRTGHPAPHREWAYTVLLDCRESGPAAIAAMWSGARSIQADEFPLLIRATHKTRDRRLYTALRSFGSTPSNDVDARLRALALLLGYADPVGLIFEPADLRMPADGPPPPMRASAHDDKVIGSEPVGDVREELRLYYLELQEGDPDPAIRNAAQILVRFIG